MKKKLKFGIEIATKISGVVCGLIAIYSLSRWNSTHQINYGIDCLICILLSRHAMEAEFDD